MPLTPVKRFPAVLSKASRRSGTGGAVERRLRQMGRDALLVDEQAIALGLHRPLVRVPTELAADQLGHGTGRAGGRVSGQQSGASAAGCSTPVT